MQSQKLTQDVKALIESSKANTNILRSQHRTLLTFDKQDLFTKQQKVGSMERKDCIQDLHGWTSVLTSTSDCFTVSGRQKQNIIALRETTLNLYLNSNLRANYPHNVQTLYKHHVHNFQSLNSCFRISLQTLSSKFNFELLLFKSTHFKLSI